MKINYFLLFNFIFVVSMIGQESNNRNDFVEFTLHNTYFINTNFLLQSDYADVIKDPLENVIGFTPATTGYNHGVKLKYGKAMLKNTHLLFDLGYIERIEQGECFCHICDKVDVGPQQLDRVKSIDFGLGIRQLLKQGSNYYFSIDAVANYSISTNKKNAKYFGYAVSPVVGVIFMDDLEFIAKIGIEQSFTTYEKIEAFVDVGMLYNI